MIGKIVAVGPRGEKIDSYINLDYADGIIIPKKTSSQIVAFVQMAAVTAQCTPSEAQTMLEKVKDRFTCHFDVPDGDIYVDPHRIMLVKIPPFLAEDNVAHIYVGPNLLDYNVPIIEAEKALFLIDTEAITFMEKH